MIVFLSIIAGISFAGTIAEGDKNKSFSQSMAMICCTAIVAIAIIQMNS